MFVIATYQHVFGKPSVLIHLLYSVSRNLRSRFGVQAVVLKLIKANVCVQEMRIAGVFVSVEISVLSFADPATKSCANFVGI